jgi:hypothetical protein
MAGNVTIGTTGGSGGMKAAGVLLGRSTGACLATRVGTVVVDVITGMIVGIVDVMTGGRVGATELDDARTIGSGVTTGTAVAGMGSAVTFLTGAAIGILVPKA